MRNSQRKQIVNMLALLDKAHTAIKKALETGNNEIALSLLEQCQDSAIQIGGMIEESVGEDFITVGMLEEYCEQIYQAYEMIRQGHPLSANKMYKKLRKELVKIDNSVRNDIRVSRAAVFLPYKASMWDSLESVWQAADADPNCDAYVIPIPYFDKNPDGSFKEMHYEGNEYPDYVPITSWEEYDIAAEHPDMIFIHNPYDEFNHVTSVHPAYYAKELRNYTDKLVYIPYFVLGNVHPDNKEGVERMEHFCAVPAVVYADKVIVQSEWMRQIYINVMAKTMGEETRKIWEEKILGLGSPKIDRVQNTQKESLEIPKEWLRIIEKPDGEWKKIVFYNTSVSALLRHSEEMLDKIEEVLSVFEENKDEVALLWRPHPLIRATIESMRPQLWQEYDKLVKKYCAEGWGIYDDTADVDRAIALSDAYYGDPSSVLQMYRETGKPIMGQRVHSDEKITEKEFKINFLAGVQVGNDIFFSAWNMNGLFKYNPETGQCNFLRCFPGEENWGVHSEAILYENTIWFIPRASERIAIIDLETLRLEYLELPENGYRQDGKNIPPRRIIGCHESGEKFLCLIPYAYKLFIKIDMEKRQIVEVQEWGEEDFARASGVRIKDKLWVSIGSTKEIRVIDVESGEQHIKKIGDEENTYIGIQNIDDKVLLFPQYVKDGVLIIDDHLNEKRMVQLDDKEQRYYEYQALAKEGDMLLVPYFGSQCVRIRVDGDDCFIKEYRDLKIEESACCSAKMIYNEQIWFLSHVTENPIMCYGKEEDMFEYRHIMMERDKYDDSVMKVMAEYGSAYSPVSVKTVWKDGDWPLNTFISFIKGAESGRRNVGEKQIGKKIYEALQ